MDVLEGSTSDGQDINVATKVDAFVYNTLAQWYNEDQAAAGSNQTLPAAPSGQQPPPANRYLQPFLGVPADWTNPTFVAVRAPVCLIACPAVFLYLAVPQQKQTPVDHPGRAR